jgi:pimeloyl-ACP methyl ester carboxylesterase
LQVIAEKSKIIESFYEGMYIFQSIVDEGAPTLVFLHDSLGCTQLWRQFPAQLAARANYNLLIYDRIGYGKSDAMATWVRPNHYMSVEAEKLIKLLDQYAVSRPILFGHSDGGTIALLAAAQAPERFTTLIVEAAHIFVEPVTIAGIIAAERSYQTSNLPERLQKYHSDKVDFLFKAWTKTWTSSTFQDWNIEKELESITCPLLFIQGTKDEYGSLQQVTKTLTSVKGRQYKAILEGVGHTPHKEVPEEVIVLSLAFLNSL